ncbi:hypothetical protein M404DRAFT_338851 [Pisolithus tinctorius Marx 270]|uniref:Uncharacterized protein n=1 Tax=Pisolithus tinctorius Marx 270 TaxID=870435 RepID=A0A0C3P4Z0_PISTI|nr:hypothetical protein M404DRAFT_338851 [Pisolithus tinctorius Marx 270]
MYHEKQTSLTACWTYRVKQSLDVWIVHEDAGESPDMIFLSCITEVQTRSQHCSTSPVGDFWALFSFSSASCVPNPHFATFASTSSLSSLFSCISTANFSNLSHHH